LNPTLTIANRSVIDPSIFVEVNVVDNEPTLDGDIRPLGQRGRRLVSKMRADVGSVPEVFSWCAPLSNPADGIFQTFQPSPNRGVMKRHRAFPGPSACAQSARDRLRIESYRLNFSGRRPNMSF
jgi:hypothetical protein